MDFMLAPFVKIYFKNNLNALKKKMKFKNNLQVVLVTSKTAREWTRNKCESLKLLCVLVKKKVTNLFIMIQILYSGFNISKFSRLYNKDKFPLIVTALYFFFFLQIQQKYFTNEIKWREIIANKT